MLAEINGHQNWVKVDGEYLTFAGSGTSLNMVLFINHHIDFIQQIVPDIEWGKRLRAILDVGYGVASFGGFIFDVDVPRKMNMKPKFSLRLREEYQLYLL